MLAGILEGWYNGKMGLSQHSIIPFDRPSGCIDHNEELSLFVAEITKFVCDA